MAEVIAHQDLEKYFIRYAELDSRQSSFHPFDTALLKILLATIPGDLPV